jgi:hypothetical protein
LIGLIEEINGIGVRGGVGVLVYIKEEVLMALY